MDVCHQWRNEPKHLGGGAQSLRGSVATERGWVWEGGVPPPTVGSFFIFRIENVQSGAYLHVRRKFRLDNMYYIIITCMELKISHGLILLGGGGASAPKPPHQYASVCHTTQGRIHNCQMGGGGTKEYCAGSAHHEREVP